MSWVPRTKAGKALALAAFIGGSIAAIAGGWQAAKSLMPFAYAEDIDKLTREQADVAIEVYQNKYRSFLALPKPAAPQQEAAWEIEIKRALKQLERAEQRKIELSK